MKNVLALFINDAKQSSDMVKVLENVSLEVKGLTIVLTVDCNDKEGKKLCKKWWPALGGGRPPGPGGDAPDQPCPVGQAPQGREGPRAGHVLCPLVWTL